MWHTLRKDPQATERRVLNWNPLGRRKGGRLKRTWRRTVKEEIGKVRKKLEPRPKTGSTGDASWKAYAPEGVKGNKASQ
jgi:hypothetical protein